MQDTVNGLFEPRAGSRELCGFKVVRAAIRSLKQKVGLTTENRVPAAKVT